MSDLDKSKDFYVRILGGKVIKPENPATSSWRNAWLTYVLGFETLKL
ncbi:MAG: VOC family protein [Candidatus Sulfotelmatobacter sp.]